MSFFVMAWIAFGCIFTAALSAVFGLAGGTILFAMLTWVMDAKQAIPIHGAVQLVSNGSRLIAYLKSVQWNVVGWFALLLFPGTYLGGLCYHWFNAQWVELLVGVFILITIFIPKKSQQQATSKATFVLLGFLSGFLGMIVAVTGPFISSFFVLNSISKERMVATKAVCQSINHFAKVLIFSTSISYDFGLQYELLLFLSAGTLVGTWIGSKLLHKIPDAQYDKLNSGLLGIIAGIMVIKGVWAMLA